MIRLSRDREYAVPGPKCIYRTRSKLLQKTSASCTFFNSKLPLDVLGTKTTCVQLTEERLVYEKINKSVLGSGGKSQA